MLKRFGFSFLLLLAISYSIFSQSIDGFNYSINDEGTITITGYIGNDANIVIPARINNIQVTAIGRNAFRGNKNITSVIIPDGIKTIDYGAFSGCENIYSLVLPVSLREIGLFAFQDCSSLIHLTLPEGLTSIKQGVFDDCTSLETVYIPASMNNIHTIFHVEAFHGCKKLTQINVNENNQKYSSVNGILYNKNKTELLLCPKGLGGIITIPIGVQSIHAGAFRDCVNITEIILPESIESIGSWAFGVCERLKKINIHQKINSIGYSAFNECNSLDTPIKEELTRRFGDVFTADGL